MLTFDENRRMAYREITLSIRCAALLLCACLLSVCGVRSHAMASNAPVHTLWTCPRGEKIAFINTGSKPGNLFILTQKGSIRNQNESWVLRLLYDDGKTRVLGTGVGRAAPISPIALSRDGNYCLVGWRRPGNPSPGYRVTCFDLRTNRQEEIKNFANVSCYQVTEPFSPDGKQLVLSVSNGGREPQHLSLIDMRTKRAKTIPGIPAGRVYATWTENADLAVWYPDKGVLYYGKPGRLAVRGRFGPSSVAYITSDGRNLTMLTDDEVKPKLLRIDIRSGSVKHLRVDDSEWNRILDPKEFQHADYSGEMTLSVMSGIKPLYIDPKGRCRNVNLGESSFFRIGSGLAIWKPSEVAFAERRSDEGPDRVVAMLMK